MRSLLLGFVACSMLASYGCGNSSHSQKGVILLRYKTGSESTEQREQGFLDTLRNEYPDIHILVDNEYAGTTPSSSLDKAQALLTKYGTRAEGIFAVCEPNSIGVLEALKDLGLNGKVKFIAFDPSEELIQGMKDGDIHGIVLQDPVTMGDKAVRTMVDFLNKKHVEKRIPTGEYVATPDNMDSKDEAGADIHKLLHPILYSDDQKAKPGTKKYRIAVIPKGTTHEFWKSIHAGAERAARDLGNVSIEWKGPLTERETEAQINVVQDFIAAKVDGICLAPNDSQALVEVVRNAKANGIPVVIFDSGLEDEDAYVSYVATDNYNGGVLAARRLAEALREAKEKERGE